MVTRRRSRARQRSGPVRVAVLDHTAALGGAELALVRLLDAVSPATADVHVVLFADGPLVERLRDTGHGVEVLPLAADVATVDRHTAGGSARHAVLNGIRVLPFVLRLGRRLRVLDVEVIYTTSLKSDLIGVPVAWLARRPLVWHVHDRISADYLPERMVRLVRLAARHAPRQVIANSRATAATLPGVRRLSVTYPGLAPEQILADPRTRPQPERPVVGIIGRISPTKGQLDFVRAAARVLEVYADTRFRIIGATLFGEQAYEARVRAEVEKLGLRHRVDFTGFVTDPTRELDALSVCVHASPTPEPFGQVILEAMARGVPVVATRGGGVSEILEPGGGEPLGRLVPAHDVDALAHAIVEVLEDPATAERVAAAWSSARERFAIDATASAVLATWRQAARPGQ